MRLHEEAPGAGPTPAAPRAGPRILLTATLRWPLAARLAMAFASLGCHVELLGPNGHPARTTRAVQRLHALSAWRPLHSLQAAIAASVPDLILPCDDTAAVQLAALHAELGAARGDALLRRRITRSLGTPAACVLATQRAALIALAADAGVRVPATTVVDGPAALEDWLASHRLPAVLKADASWGGHGVEIVQRAAQARQAFARLSARPSALAAIAHALRGRDPSAFAAALHGTPRRVINLQAHVEGLPANHAVACWQGQVLAGISVLALRTQHATGPATVVQVIEHAEMALAARRIVQRLGLSGLWGLDFVLDPVTQAAHLIEINPRATPISHLPLGPGHDLPAALCARWRGTSPARAVQPVPAIVSPLITLFPGATRWPGSHHDRPTGEPRFVRDGLAPPWAERGLAAQAWSWLRPHPPTVRQRTDPPPGRDLQPASPAPGPGAQPETGAALLLARCATDASR